MNPSDFTSKNAPSADENFAAALEREKTKKRVVTGDYFNLSNT